MDTSTTTLVITFGYFLACLLISGFSFFINTKSNREPWLKIITLFFGLAGLFGAFYLLVASFVDYIK